MQNYKLRWINDSGVRVESVCGFDLRTAEDYLPMYAAMRGVTDVEIVKIGEEIGMAQKVIQVSTCDACFAKDGSEVEATGKLDIFGDEYDVCDPHGKKFRAWFADALKSTTSNTKSA